MSIITDTKIVSLNSEDGVRRNGTYLSNMIFDLPNLIKDDKTVIHRQISVLNAQLPFSFYNVNTNYNFLRLIINGSTYNIYVADGNYNSTNLFSTLTSAIFVASAQTINFAISSITGLITMTSTANFSISNVSTMSKLLGFVQGTTYASTLVGSTYTLVGIYPLNLLGTKKLQLRCSILSMNNYSSNNGGLNTLLLTIPVNASPFGMIDYTSISNSLISFSNSNLDEIDLTITDAEDNNLIDFHNQHWTITLAIYEYKKLPDVPIANLETSTTQLFKEIPIVNKKKEDPILQFLEK
jgi:hypothetical protein